MASLAGFVCDDDLAYAPFAALGWRVEAADWRRSDMDWRSFDAVVIRSTWDYPSDHEGFLGVLANIEAAGTPLANSRRLAQWNLRKSYLHGRLVHTYALRRIARGDGTREPAYDEYIAAAPPRSLVARAW